MSCFYARTHAAFCSSRYVSVREFGIVNNNAEPARRPVYMYHQRMEKSLELITRHLPQTPSFLPFLTNVCLWLFFFNIITFVHVC